MIEITTTRTRYRQWLTDCIAIYGRGDAQLKPLALKLLAEDCKRDAHDGTLWRQLLHMIRGRA